MMVLSMTLLVHSCHRFFIIVLHLMVDLIHMSHGQTKLCHADVPILEFVFRNLHPLISSRGSYPPKFGRCPRTFVYYFDGTSVVQILQPPVDSAKYQGVDHVDLNRVNENLSVTRPQ